jgi:hypothetical protein
MKEMQVSTAQRKITNSMIRKGFVEEESSQLALEKQVPLDKWVGAGAAKKNSRGENGLSKGAG